MILEMNGESKDIPHKLIYLSQTLNYKTLVYLFDSL